MPTREIWTRAFALRCSLVRVRGWGRCLPAGSVKTLLCGALMAFMAGVPDMPARRTDRLVTALRCALVRFSCWGAIPPAGLAEMALTGALAAFLGAF